MELLLGLRLWSRREPDELSVHLDLEMKVIVGKHLVHEGDVLVLDLAVALLPLCAVDIAVGFQSDQELRLQLLDEVGSGRGHLAVGGLV